MVTFAFFIQLFHANSIANNLQLAQIFWGLVSPRDCLSTSSQVSHFTRAIQRPEVTLLLYRSVCFYLCILSIVGHSPPPLPTWTKNVLLLHSTTPVLSLVRPIDFSLFLLHFPSFLSLRDQIFSRCFLSSWFNKSRLVKNSIENIWFK